MFSPSTISQTTWYRRGYYRCDASAAVYTSAVEITVTADNTAGTASTTPTLCVNTALTNITIATTGNATDFGDLTTATAALDGVSNTIRGVTGGGETPSKTNTMNKITIASTGNATDYGDLIFSVGKPSGASNGHGGLVGG